MHACTVLLLHELLATLHHIKVLISARICSFVMYDNSESCTCSASDAIN